jgi:hypothetical protein
MVSNVHLVAACLPLNVVEKSDQRRSSVPTLLHSVTGHSLCTTTTNSSVTKESAIL